MTHHFTDSTFAKESAKGFVVVDMYADWCGPCKMMGPIFEEVAKEYVGKAKMGKMNVDESTEVPGKFGVSSIPTIVFLKDGVEVARMVGFQSKDALVKQLKDIGVK